MRANKVCVPESSLCLLLLQESHGGGLMGHFARDKTYAMLANKFFWPRMFRDVGRFVRRCTTCGKVKFKAQSHGLTSTRGGVQSRQSSLSVLHRQSSHHSRPARNQFSMITTSILICDITLSRIVLTTVLLSGNSSARASRNLISWESRMCASKSYASWSASSTLLSRDRVEGGDYCLLNPAAHIAGK